MTKKSTDSKTGDRVAPEVVLDNITTIIDDQPVLYRLNLTIPAGQVTVLMGPSGAGKSTLIKHIVGLLRPGGGSVRIGERDVWTASTREWEKIYSDVGAMLGGSFLVTGSTFGSLSALDNLTYTLEAIRVPFEERHDRAMARLRELNLDGYYDHTPAQLAAHATKRLALARALVTDAPLIVLDEIEVGLDQEHSRGIVSAIQALRERTSCTVLITTHNLELARELADHLAILVQGQIAAEGTPAQLLTGISSAEDLEQSYQFESGVSSVSLEDARTSTDWGRPTAPRKRPSDRLMLALAIVLGFVVVVVLLVLKLH